MNKTLYKTLKLMMIFLNVLFLLGGVALLGVGLWIIIDYELVMEVFKFTNLRFIYQYLSYIAVVVGGVTIFLSLFGCIGAWRDSLCILGVFIFVLVVFLKAEIAALTFVLFFTENLNKILLKTLKASIQNQYGVLSVVGKTTTDAWDFIQTTFSCCGFSNGSDYAESVFDAGINSTQPWPLTCCVRDTKGDYIDEDECLMSSKVTSMTSHAAIGCFQHLKSQVTTHAVALASMVVGVMLLQILAITFASGLIHQIKRKKRVDVE